MLAAPPDWVEMVEVNPPRLPSMTHLQLRGRWQNVLITDNPFKQVRVSPYAFAARITHDVPGVRPTVVCSTRDRNILAIESEVRGAIANGVQSFLVVQGDMLPEVEHWSNSYEIVEHLRALQASVARVQLRGRHEHPIAPMDVPPPRRDRRPVPHHRPRHGSRLGARVSYDRLELRPDDPPVYLEITPPMTRALGRAARVRRRPADQRRAPRLACAAHPRPRRRGSGLARRRRQAARLRAGGRASPGSS